MVNSMNTQAWIYTAGATIPGLMWFGGIMTLRQFVQLIIPRSLNGCPCLYIYAWHSPALVTPLCQIEGLLPRTVTIYRVPNSNLYDHRSV